MYFKGDLHCHSTYSDGTLSPAELIQLACRLGLHGLSITDHDIIESYQEALSIAQENNLLMITGVEFSAMHQNNSVHILAYSFPTNSPVLMNFCSRHSQRRLKRNQAILDSLSSHGLPLSYEEILHETHEEIPHHSVGRPHIALAMVKKGYVANFQEAFRNYLGEGKKCYVAGESFSVEETLDVIHQSQGLAVIAHPHLIKQPRMLSDLLQMNFDGIEGYYARFPKSEQERWVKIGAKKGWIVTGGSDFHGDIKNNHPLGSSWVNEETFSILLKRFQSNQSQTPLS